MKGVRRKEFVACRMFDQRSCKSPEVHSSLFYKRNGCSKKTAISLFFILKIYSNKNTMQVVVFDKKVSRTRLSKFFENKEFTFVKDFFKNERDAVSCKGKLFATSSIVRKNTSTRIIYITIFPLFVRHPEILNNICSTWEMIFENVAIH